MSKQMLETMQCTHYRQPCGEYVYYIPPIAVIADLIHHKTWNQFMGLSEQNIIDIVKYCSVTGSYSLFTAKNMLDICDKIRFKEAALLLSTVQRICYCDISSTDIAYQSSIIYSKARNVIVSKNSSCYYIR